MFSPSVRSVRSLIKSDVETKSDKTNLNNNNNDTSKDNATKNNPNVILSTKLNETGDNKDNVSSTVDNTNNENYEQEKQYIRVKRQIQQVRLILALGLITVNILVIGYIVLMYAFLPVPCTVKPCTCSANNDSYASLWRTAGVVTLLNGIPIVGALIVSAQNNTNAENKQSNVRKTV